ncbi:hypothetical protein EDC96DRAFT_571031 [Choanephora cucurbitarum]|nr:hypothetical protein EDC96DRAFT_571031 [Choanephora cucurbitarum]
MNVWRKLTHDVARACNFNRLINNNKSQRCQSRAHVTSNEEETASPVVKRRKRVVEYVWYTEYKCHRSGTYRDRVAEGSRTKGGSGGKARDLQKASKKTDCKAKLKVVCFKRDPENVEIVHIDTHNHDVGGMDDLKYLPLSNERKAIISERLREGYSKRDCRIAIQKDFRKFISEFLTDGSGNDNRIYRRDQVVHQGEIHNLYKKIQETFYMKSSNEKESVKLWLKDLEEKGYSTFVGNDYDNSFTFGFSSPWQKRLLLNY